MPRKTLSLLHPVSKRINRVDATKKFFILKPPENSADVILSGVDNPGESSNFQAIIVILPAMSKEILVQEAL